MWNALNNPDFMNTVITIAAMGAFVSGLVAFYFALTYVPEVVAARLARRKR